MLAPPRSQGIISVSSSRAFCCGFGNDIASVSTRDLHGEDHGKTAETAGVKPTEPAGVKIVLPGFQWEWRQMLWDCRGDEKNIYSIPTGMWLYLTF